MYLVGDIGGTHTRLAVVNAKGKFLCVKYYLSTESSFDDMIAHFLFSCGHRPTKACFGVAGPVKDNVAKTTNLSLVVDGHELSKKFHMTVKIINDFEALAHGVFLLKKKDLVQLNKATPFGDVAVVMGPGTGLGEAIMYKNNVLSGEGGHADFSARTKQEVELKKWLKSNDTEDVVSGRGIVNIFRFLSKKYKVPLILKKYLRDDDPAAVISYQALNNKFPICVKTMEQFITFYAREAQSLALKAKATKGVYLAGNISVKNLPLLKKWFMKEFVTNQKMGSLLKKMPVYVITNKDVSLLGAWRVAKGL